MKRFEIPGKKGIKKEYLREKPYNYVGRRIFVDVMTKAQRHKNMQHIISHDTRPEIKLRMALWQRGIRYRKNYRKLYGTPDIVLTKYKIAIFVDGDFWHAHGHETHPGEQVNSNKEYWQNKLARNVERDKEVNDALVEEGWIVLRFWESDIKKNLSGCVNEILEYI